MCWRCNNETGNGVATTKALCFWRGSVQKWSLLKGVRSEGWSKNQASDSRHPLWAVRSMYTAFPVKCLFLMSSLNLLSWPRWPLKVPSYSKDSVILNCTLWPLSPSSPEALSGWGGHWECFPRVCFYPCKCNYIESEVPKAMWETQYSKINWGFIFKFQSSTDEKVGEERQWQCSTSNLVSRSLTSSYLVSSE